MALLDDPAFDDMGVLAFHEPIKQAGPSNQAYLADTQGKGRLLWFAV